MIVVQLYGGLGNQMFQYAAGLRLAAHHGVRLKVDRGSLPWFGDRKYGLGCFKLHRLSPDRFKLATRNIAQAQSVAAALALRGQVHVAEKHFHFDPSILDAPANAFLDGYWQSEKYFADHSALVRAHFTFRQPLPPGLTALSGLIGGSNSVGLHVRRGDYLLASDTIHEACPLDYYQRAVDHLLTLVPDPHFFLFSDDPNWVRDSLKLKHPATLVSGQYSHKDHHDLRLISQCRHQIIANSTFSWWAAWLNQNPSKLVIAPRDWFVPTARLNCGDVVPEGWIRL